MEQAFIGLFLFVPIGISRLLASWVLRFLADLSSSLRLSESSYVCYIYNIQGYIYNIQGFSGRNREKYIFFPRSIRLDIL